MRLVGLDTIRGIAVWLMIVFHIFYYGKMFHIIEIDIEHALPWRIFRTVIIALFLFCMAVSLHMIHADGIRMDKLIKRCVKLGSAALLISIVTMVAYPQKWVFFGIIHFIWLTSIFALPLLRRVVVSWIIALSVFALYFGGFVTYGALTWQVARLFSLPQYTVDFVPLIPWFGVVALWMGFVAKGWHMPIVNAVRIDNQIGAVFAYTGRYALAIYLIHFPVLYVLFWIVA